VLEQLVKCFADYNSVHPHSALRYRSADEFREDNGSE
jgi:transposase InsO family protein